MILAHPGEVHTCRGNPAPCRLAMRTSTSFLLDLEAGTPVSLGPVNARQCRLQIDLFLRTGDHDMLFADWPGQNVIDKAQLGSKALADALVAEVRRREALVTVRLPDGLPRDDLVAFTRSKVGPMVRGLFPRSEVGPVLGLLEHSVVFLTPENIEPAIRNEGFLDTAWQVANLYLASIGAGVLAEDRKYAVGISADTTCYVSLEYFSEDDPFADFVVHEAAHVFHNTKRGAVGLKQTRRREWLLPIDFGRRETFAYACEAYSRIVENGKTPGERRALATQLKQRNAPPPDDRVDHDEYLAIITEAVNRRNGWKAILDACSSNHPRKQP